MLLNKTKLLFRLLRIDNWIKNLLILLPCFFAKKITNYSILIDVIIAAIIFSLLASSVYIINDLIDAPKDRNYPSKKNRPIAAKTISVRNAIIILVIVILVTSGLSWIYLNRGEILLLGFYLLFNLLYSLFLKNILIIDFFAIPIFFEIRLFYGGFVSEVVLSHWLILIVFFFATLIAIGKRRDDILILESTKANTRNTAKYYTIQFLDAMVLITSSLLVFIYIIYSISDWVCQNYSHYFFLSDLFVVMCLSKYLHSVFVENKSGDPIKLIFRDYFILSCLTLWLLSIISFIYYV